MGGSIYFPSTSRVASGVGHFSVPRKSMCSRKCASPCGVQEMVQGFRVQSGCRVYQRLCRINDACSWKKASRTCSPGFPGSDITFPKKMKKWIQFRFPNVSCSLQSGARLLVTVLVDKKTGYEPWEPSSNRLRALGLVDEQVASPWSRPQQVTRPWSRPQLMYCVR